jgi:hypothetical protein
MSQLSEETPVRVLPKQQDSASHSGGETSCFLNKFLVLEKKF